MARRSPARPRSFSNSRVRCRANCWIPEEALSREEALYAATMAGAYAMHAEDILGSIEIGKLADPAEVIWKIEPDMTVFGGDVVYSRPVEAQ